MPAGQISGKLNLNAAGWSQTVDKSIREIKKLQEASSQAGKGTVSSMQAASASIRLIEGDFTRNTRAVERFISSIPGVGKALQAVFPLVGAAATIGILARMGDEIYKTVHDLGQIKNVANEGFIAINQGAQKNADTLRVSNDKLEQQIAILEHKPVNNLALALDEARVRADDLAASLNKDYEAVKKVIEESQKGVAATLFNGGVDRQLGGGIEDRLANIRTLARQQRDATTAGDTAAVADLDAKLRAAQEEAKHFADNQRAMRTGIANAGTVREAPYAKVYGDQGLNLDTIDKFKDLISSQEDTADQQKRNTADQEKVRALEQSNKAQADLYTQMQETIAKQKAQYGVSVADELAYWSARVNAFSKGSEEYKKVLMDQYRLQSELAQQLNEGKKKYLESQKGTVEGNDLVDKGAQAFSQLDLEQQERASRSLKEYNAEVAKGAAEAQKEASAFAESSLQIALQQGAISELAAAQALAAIHADDHAKALLRINEALADQIKLINADPKLTDQDKGLAIRNAQQSAANETLTANGSFAVTQQSDAQRVRGQQLGPAMQDTLRKIGQDWSNMTQSILQITTKTIDSFNDDITKAITGHGSKADFGKTFAQAGEGLVKTGLQKGESALLGGLFGKGGTPGSSPTNPIFASIVGAGGIGGAAGGAAAPLLGGLAAKLGGFIQPFIPHFAAGGDFVGGPMMVGEKGPEILNPGFSGSITPNSAIGGGHTTVLHVDARGSNDPAAIHAAIMRAAPALISASVQAQHHAAKRSPRGR